MWKPPPPSLTLPPAKPRPLVHFFKNKIVLVRLIVFLVGDQRDPMSKTEINAEKAGVLGRQILQSQQFGVRQFVARNFGHSVLPFCVGNFFFGVELGDKFLGTGSIVRHQDELLVRRYVESEHAGAGNEFGDCSEEPPLVPRSSRPHRPSPRRKLRPLAARRGTMHRGES